MSLIIGGGSRLLSHMSMLNGNSIEDDYKIFPGIPTKYTTYNIFSGGLENNIYGYPVMNGGLFPRICNIIGESATGKTSFMIGSVASAVDYIRQTFGSGYSEMFMFDVENNTPISRFLDLANWSSFDFTTKCNYSNKDLTLVELTNLVIKIALEKQKYMKDYMLPSGLRDVDGREVRFLAPTYICVDSVAAVNPNGIEQLVEMNKAGEFKDLDKISSNTEAMQDAKAWTIFVRKIKPYLDMGNIGLYFINHKTKEVKMDMYAKEKRYLPFLGMGEKIKGGAEFIYQSYNILHFDSGEKYNEKNPIYGSDIEGFSARVMFAKNKGNIEGRQFPMVFDMRRGYVPELSDFEYLWQTKTGIEGTSRITLDVLPEVSFTRKTLMETLEEYPQLGRAIQFTSKYKASCDMLFGCNSISLKDFGTNIPLNQRLAILYGYTKPYAKESGDAYTNFAALAHENMHYYNYGDYTKSFSLVTPSNNDIINASKGYTITSEQSITPYDVDLGLAKTDGKYQRMLTKDEIEESKNKKK